jgi:hypothetical protein
MSARQDDKSFQRMMQGAAGSSARPPADCPDPEILAAYWEQSLEATEQARWEEHFSNCLRCQSQLVALVRSDLEPAPGRGWLKDWRHAWSEAVPAPARSAPAATSPGVASNRPEAKPRLAWLTQWHYAWRWVVPAGALAVAIALWVAVRPPSHSLDRLVASKKEIAVATATPPNPAAASAEELKKAARNFPALPPPPPAMKRAASSTHTNGRINEAFSKKKAEPASATPARPSVAAAPAASEFSHADALREQILLAKPAQQQEGQTKTAAKEEKQEKSLASGQLAVTGARPAPTEDSPKPMAALPRALPNATQQRANAAAGDVVAQGSINGRSGLALMATDQSNWVLVPSRGGKTLWRIGPAGAIERSLDLGLTWQGQFADEKESLLAGWAPSGQVCWVVGRGGTVLRTTDGQHWERMTSPAAVDLTAVTAKNAQKATVTTADQRKFTTADGGQSWEAVKK